MDRLMKFQKLINCLETDLELALITVMPASTRLWHIVPSQDSIYWTSFVELNWSQDSRHSYSSHYLTSFSIAFVKYEKQ